MLYSSDVNNTHLTEIWWKVPFHTRGGDQQQKHAYTLHFYDFVQLPLLADGMMPILHLGRPRASLKSVEMHTI